MARGRLGLLCTFAGGLLFGLILGTARPLYSSFPKQWQYQVVVVDPYEILRNKVYQKFLKRYNQNTVKAQAAFLQYLCNQMGRDRFELVSLGHFGPKGRYLRLIFKRER